jgi:hypothetical protein
MTLAANNTTATTECGLLADLIAVLERYGFRAPADERDRQTALAATLGATLDLIDAYRGERL